MTKQGSKSTRSILLAACAAIVVTAGIGAGSAFAEEDSYILSSDYLFVPKGFDDNDSVQVVMDGWMNSSCDQVEKPKVAVHPDQYVIEVEVKATRPGELYCMPVLTRFTVVADLGILAEGTYSVVTNNGWLVEELVVAEAASGGPDDYRYAQIDKVFVDYAPDEPGVRDSKWSALLFGTFRTSCESLDFIEVADSGSTIEVLPVLKVEGEICLPVETPFEHRVFLPDIVQEGRYLLHVRTSDGNAVNHVFSAFE